MRLGGLVSTYSVGWSCIVCLGLPFDLGVGTGSFSNLQITNLIISDLDFLRSLQNESSLSAIWSGRLNRICIYIYTLLCCGLINCITIYTIYV